MEQSTLAQRGGLGWGVLIGSMVALASCSSLPFAVSDHDDTGVEGLGQDGSELEADEGQLEVVEIAAEVFCDSNDHVVAEIEGAEAGERLVVSSGVPIDLTPEQMDATADINGVYELTWRCDTSEAGQPWELRVVGETSGRRATVSFVGTAFDPANPSALPVTLTTETVVCDGSTTEIGTLSNASAGERLVFTSPEARTPADAVADSVGRAAINWQCEPSDAGTATVTVRGATSNRLGEFAITGVVPPPEDAPPPVAVLEEDPFVCDSGTRPVASVSGFFGNELVRFDSPQSSLMRDGRTDADGQVIVRWTCDADDVGKTWQVTAVGGLSRREVTFSFTGAAGPPRPDPTVTLAEDPFRCDSATRVVAVLGGLIRGEFVDFTSPQTEDLRQGQADTDGSLQVRWTCTAADVGRTWEVTATGATSGGSVTFTITGAAP